MDNKLIENAQELYDKIPDNVQRFTWDFRRKDLMRMIIENNGLDDFLTWPIVSEALFSQYTKYAEKERAQLPQRVREFARDPSIGHPKGWMSPERASGTMIHQFLIAQTVNLEMVGLPFLGTVVEIGGGYGALAYAMRRMGFASDYWVYDFPELHLIRNWYLDQLAVKTYSLSPGMGPFSGDIELLIASHSLCEIEPGHREAILECYPSKWYYVSITRRFDEIDNYRWFKKWFKRHNVAFYEKESANTNQAIFVGLRAY